MEPATEKQINFARKLGIENPEMYDKQALRGLIDVKTKGNPNPAPRTQPEASKPSSDPYTGYMEAKNAKSYHLTPEQVKTNALEAAQRWYPTLADNVDDIKNFWLCVHEFEKYISS